jgi:hypothetical protein
MAKTRSDIFICNTGRNGYWAYPSPFVAHGGGTEIQFRNLTNDDIVIDLKGAPVDRARLPLARNGSGSVTVSATAVAGLYEYEAVVTVAPATRSSRASRTSARRRTVKVKGGSSPKVIIDA